MISYNCTLTNIPPPTQQLTHSHTAQPPRWRVSIKWSPDAPRTTEPHGCCCCCCCGVSAHTTPPINASVDATRSEIAHVCVGMCARITSPVSTLTHTHTRSRVSRTLSDGGDCGERDTHTHTQKCGCHETSRESRALQMLVKSAGELEL